MEDGSNGPLLNVELSDRTKNGVVGPIMANFPEGTVAITKEDKVNIENAKVNGESTADTENNVSDIESYNSESDTLIIDESIPKRRKYKKRSSRSFNNKLNTSDILNSAIVTETEKHESDSQDNVVKVNDEQQPDIQGTVIKECNEKDDDSQDKVTPLDVDILESNLQDCVCEIDLKEDTEDKRETITRDNEQELKEESDITYSSEVLTHSNPYFNESLFELSQLHHTDDNTETSSEISKICETEEVCKLNKQKRSKSKPKPKLKEYAQYLGLQPTVQFKCSKCGKAGFESLNTLQDHLIQCNAVQSIQEKSAENESSFSGFKLKRRVFLCSSCGTYYENWNLYMHMLEFHRRYICLYCLGMFSILEDLCQHIQSRHNLEPGHKNSLDEFFNVYNEPCYIVCCECNKLFNEQDNFFYHNCIGTKNNTKNKTKQIKKPILPENHVTGESGDVTVDEPSNLEKESSEKENNQEAENQQVESVEIIQANNEKQADSDSRAGSEKEKTSDTEVCDNKYLIGTDERTDSNTEEIPDDTSEVLENNQKDNLSDKVEVDNLTNQVETVSEKDFDNSINSSLENSEEHHENLADMENIESDQKFDLDDDNFITDKTETMETEPVETRKVPKLSLKLPKPGSYPEPEDSDDSEKLTMEVDHIESENETEPIQEEKNLDPQVQVAGLDTAISELELEQPLDKIDIKVLLQKCLKTTAPTCIYCNHARKIAVNGKQLGLHAVAEHRYSAIVKSITAEELIPESFVARIKESLDELESVFFNLESAASDEAVTFSHVFECFQCRYSTTVHKELYLHNRKFHSKNLLLCIMCKSNFYSYSELICHLCPGQYVLDYDLQFRCCMCVSDDLPSSFRLMVHLRKRHNVCDVCLEMCHNQYKLSNHVWKHKLHHFCYRCGIAYRNKPDITRHLFWKHGTESLLCKKCLQKKWPHVYHFCVPPSIFTCEECNLTFTRAVSLKVHKRLHTDEKKHACTFEGCTEKFISKKLMLKHELKHREPPEDEKKVEDVKEEEEPKNEPEVKEEKQEEQEKKEEESPKPPKPKIDVYDLPELNLSESDSSDSETETGTDKPIQTQPSDDVKTEADEVAEDKKMVETDTSQTLEDIKPFTEEITPIEKPLSLQIEEETSTSVIQNIWDNFKNYQANKEKLDHMFSETEKPESAPETPLPLDEEKLALEIVLRDHDYCIDPERNTDTSLTEVMPDLTLTERVDHDYCVPHSEHGMIAEKPPPDEVVQEKEEVKESPKKTPHSSASSSSDSDSSSCSCGSNCSCSSSSGSSSSSSDSSDSDSSTEEGRRKQQARRQRRKQKNTEKEMQSESKVEVDVVATDHPAVTVETPIQESDLETTESETDEEFYDKQPQKLAKKILEEKRAQLLAVMGPNSVPNGTFIESTSRPPTPPAGTVEEEEEPKPKKKKTKKRKKRKSEKKDHESRERAAALQNVTVPPYYQQYHPPPTVAPITLSISRNSPTPTISATVAPATPTPVYSKVHAELLRQDSSDSSLRASKRRRVPNKFYGYSSDEESDKASGATPKWRRMEVSPAPRSPMTVPPITIKTGPPPAPHPTVEPISIRLPTTTHPGDFRVHQKGRMPPIRLIQPPAPPPQPQGESGSDSNDTDEEQVLTTLPKPDQPQLYCYCRCPYDEVSEMIGCDSSDCAIEWFHFECVGIMVPPKGQWFCPDCRKKKQQRRDLLQA